MTSERTVNIVVGGLVLVVLAVVGCAAVLAYQSKTVPDALIGFGGTAVGAVAGILSRTSTNEG